MYRIHLATGERVKLLKIQGFRYIEDHKGNALVELTVFDESAGVVTVHPSLFPDNLPTTNGYLYRLSLDPVSFISENNLTKNFY